MSNWISDFKERVRRLLSYTNDIEKQNEYLLKRLRMISQNYYSGNYRECNQTSIRALASETLEQAAKMQRREKPHLFYL